MFTYFHKNKFSLYEKSPKNVRGQLTTVFIVVIATVIIMAFATINLGKVASFKTETSNATDSGALAGGSIMANLFNKLAQLNSSLIAGYEEFFMGVSGQLLIALMKASQGMSLATAAASQGGSGALACSDPCTAEKNATIAGKTMGQVRAPANMTAKAVRGAMVATIGFWLAQYYLYLIMRKLARKYRVSAIGSGHRFSFTNNNVGSKLKEVDIPKDITDELKKKNYRTSFQKFMEQIGDDTEAEREVSEYIYKWDDGSDRGHSINSKIKVDPVTKFVLKVTVAPFPLELVLFVQAWTAAEAAEKSAQAATKAYEGAAAALKKVCAAKTRCTNSGGEDVTACAEFESTCAAAGAQLDAANGLATATAASLGKVIKNVPLIWLGLLPAWEVTNNNGSGALLWIIAYVQKIKHDHLFKADSTQEHGSGAIILKKEIESAGLDWNKTVNILITNGWAMGLTDEKIELTVADLEQEKEEMMKAFAEDFDKIWPILKKALSNIFNPKYPKVRSNSTADFSGGSIYPPVASYDPDIVKVDSK